MEQLKMTEKDKEIINLKVEISSLESANKLYKKEIIRLRKVVDRQDRIISKMQKQLKKGELK